MKQLEKLRQKKGIKKQIYMLMEKKNKDMVEEIVKLVLHYIMQCFKLMD